MGVLMPVVVTVGGWQLALWAYEHFGCQGGIKNLEPCFAGDVNILPLLGIGLFWCQILSWLTVPISAGLLAAVAAKHFKAKSSSF